MRFLFALLSCILVGVGMGMVFTGQVIIGLIVSAVGVIVAMIAIPIGLFRTIGLFTLVFVIASGLFYYFIG